MATRSCGRRRLLIERAGVSSRNLLVMGRWQLLVLVMAMAMVLVALACTSCSRNYKIEIQEDDVTMHRVASPQGGRD